MLRSTQRGFVYLWALYTVVLAGIAMAGAAHVWQARSQREKEAELMFIGEQFRMAIKSYQSTGTKQYPKTLEELIEDKRTPNVVRHLRKMYVDPITNTTEWGIVEETPAGANQGAAASNTAANNPNTAAGNQATTGNTAAGGNTGMGGASGLGSGGAAANTSQGSSNSLTPGGTAASTTSTGTSTSTNPAGTGSAASSGIGKAIGSNLGTNLEKRITGVYSLSERKPIKKSGFPEHFKKFAEAKTYQDWQFVHKPGDTKGAAGQGGATNKPAAGAGGAAASSPFAPKAGSGSSNKPASSPFGQSSSDKQPSDADGSNSPFGR